MTLPLNRWGTEDELAYIDTLDRTKLLQYLHVASKRADWGYIDKKTVLNTVKRKLMVPG